MGAKARSSRAGRATPGPVVSPTVPAAAPDLKPPRRRLAQVIPLRVVAVLILIAAGRRDLFWIRSISGPPPGTDRQSRIRRAAVRHSPRALAPLAHATAPRGRSPLLQGMGGLGRRSTAQAVLAVDQARKLGFDPDLLDCLAAIYHARADRFNEAEPVLEQAFLDEIEPREMVAKELAQDLLVDLPPRTGGPGDRTLADPGAEGSPTLPLEQRNRLAVRCRSRDPDPELSGRARARPQARQGSAGPGPGAQQGSSVRRGRAGIRGLSETQPQGRLRVAGPGTECVPARRHRQVQAVLRNRRRGQPARPRDPQGARPDRPAARPVSSRRCERLAAVDPDPTVRPRGSLFLCPGAQTRRR